MTMEGLSFTNVNDCQEGESRIDSTEKCLRTGLAFVNRHRLICRFFSKRNILVGYAKTVEVAC